MPLPETTDLPRDVRVALMHDEYLSEYADGGSGRYKAGDVLIVDERTARRWLEKGIARPAAGSDKTRREQKLAELARVKAELEALEAVEVGTYRELDVTSVVPTRGRPAGSRR